MRKIKWIVLLHALLFVYSLGSVCSKIAAGQTFGSLQFLLLYGCLIFTLMVYAVGWQQIIKRIPLTTAFANKAVTVVWGIIWGALFFGEKITAGKLIGAAFVVAGVILFAGADEPDSADEVNHE